jgi:ZIP family zinc transporter
VDQNVLFAFALTALAGLSTGIGSALAFFTKHTNTRFLSLSLGFSAGVMVYISFVELLAQAQSMLSTVYGEKLGSALGIAAFFGGMLAITLIDRFVPSYENPHQARMIEDMDRQVDRAKLLRMGILSALAIGIHNFPEGLATFFSALSHPTTGISIAVAIALHNIPEGVSVSVPVYFATGSRSKAFWLSFLSGVSEPAGALIGYALLRPVLSDALLGILYGAVAGVMVFISLDQLLPNAKQYGEGHMAVYGLISGMAIIAATLILLA